MIMIMIIIGKWFEPRGISYLFCVNVLGEGSL